MPDKIILQPGREKSVLRHHPWIFSHAIKEIEGSPEEGGEVEVFSSSMEWLAVASLDVEENTSSGTGSPRQIREGSP